MKPGADLELAINKAILQRIRSIWLAAVPKTGNCPWNYDLVFGDNDSNVIRCFLKKSKHSPPITVLFIVNTGLGEKTPLSRQLSSLLDRFGKGVFVVVADDPCIRSIDDLLKNKNSTKLKEEQTVTLVNLATPENEHLRKSVWMRVALHGEGLNKAFLSLYNITLKDFLSLCYIGLNPVIVDLLLKYGEKVENIREFSNIIDAQGRRKQVYTIFHGARMGAVQMASIYRSMFDRAFPPDRNNPNITERESPEKFVLDMFWITQYIKASTTAPLIHKILNFVMGKYANYRTNFHEFKSKMPVHFRALSDNAQECLKNVLSHFDSFYNSERFDDKSKFLIYGCGETLRSIVAAKKDVISFLLLISENYPEQYYQSMLFNVVDLKKDMLVTSEQLEGYIKNHSIGCFMISLDGTAEIPDKDNLQRVVLREEPPYYIAGLNSPKKNDLPALLEILKPIKRIAITEIFKHEKNKDYEQRIKTYNIKPVLINFTDFTHVITDKGVFETRDNDSLQELFNVLMNEQINKEIKKDSQSLSNLMTEASGESCG